MKRSNIRGFTLIELLVVVAIVAILAMIAYPSYTEQVRKSRRGTAQACLMELAQYMERFYTTNMRYDQDTGGTAVALPNTDCVQDLNNFYTFSFSGNVTQTAFTIQAAPTGAQAGDTCGTLTIDQAGQKTPTTSGCWAN